MWINGISTLTCVTGNVLNIIRNEYITICQHDTLQLMAATLPGDHGEVVRKHAGEDLRHDPEAAAVPHLNLAEDHVVVYRQTLVDVTHNHVQVILNYIYLKTLNR